MELLVTEKGDVLKENHVSFREREKQREKEEEIEKEQLKRERSSPFNRWAQFNLEHGKKLMRFAMKYPQAQAILFFLVDHMDEYNAVMCSYKVFQELFEISKPTVTRAIKVLKEHGLIAVLKSGSSNIYAINDKVFWKSWGNNLRYSKFPANVVLSLSEQDKEYQAHFKNLQTTKHKEVSAKDEQ